jgi:hypothetical protein
MELVVVFGPPAVGKMTVGRELGALTGYPLLHNHLTIEPLLAVFEWSSPSFQRLKEEFRRRVLEEAVASRLPGLVMTFVWGLELAADAATVRWYVDLVVGAGGTVRFVELVAPLAVRQERNNTALRLEHKASKRDRAFNDADILAQEVHVMTSGAVTTPADAVLAAHPHLRLDNTELPPAEAARRVAEWLAAQRQR